MKQAAIITFWFMLAYLLALAAAYALTARIVGQALDPFGPGVDSVMFTYVLPPLAALSVFQLVFGLATRIGRSWRYWPIGLPLVYLGAGVAIWLYVSLGQPWQAAIAAFVVITGGVGLWLSLRSAGRAT